MHENPIRESARGVEVDVLVVPNASRATVIGVHGNRVKIRVTSAPEKNKANAAVIELMRQVTGVRRAEVIRGRTGRHKTVLLIGATTEAVRERLTTGSSARVESRRTTTHPNYEQRCR